MAFQGGTPKMSLVAQYDDLCRYTKILTAGSEQEFKMFVESQLNCVRKWKESDFDKRKLMDKINSLEAESRRLETQMKHVRNLLKSEVLKRKEVEKEKKAMANQIALIKEVLLADSTMDNQTKEKLAFLNTHIGQISPPRDLSDEEVDAALKAVSEKYKLEKKNLTTIEESAGSLISSDVDCTVDDDDDFGCSIGKPRKSSKGKRRSSGRKTGSPKRKKSDKIETELAYDRPENGDMPFKNIGVRCNSEPTKNDNAEIFENAFVHRSDSDQNRRPNTYDLRRTVTGTLSLGTPVGSRYSLGGKLSRSHSFANKVIVRSEKCVPCGLVIKFMKPAWKCQDCRVVCHPECQDKCPLPCIPTVSTPTKGSVGTINDYVSSTPPMIPSLIVHCVNEIESRGFKDTGLYRASGSDREIKDLKEKFLRGKSVPCLAQVDIHAICGTVKEFLRSLKEPLIPRSAWRTFVDAAEDSDMTRSLNALYDAVVDLPQANRDTLAFMILHLQRVAESEHCKMPVDNIAKIFGPTILGYSSANPSDANMYSETAYQINVVRRLLSISADSWQKLLNAEIDVFMPTFVKTPETTPAPKGTRLGPIKPRNVTVAKTPLTPRNVKQRQQFSSPHLKNFNY